MDNQEYFAPSQIARLILGYLKENSLNKTFSVFLRECPDLSEYWRLLLKGKTLSTSIMGYSLTQILNEFGELKLSAIRAGQSRIRPVVPLGQESTVNDSLNLGDSDVRASVEADGKSRREKDQRRESRQKQRAAIRSASNQAVSQNSTEQCCDKTAAVVQVSSVPGPSGTQEPPNATGTSSPLKNATSDTCALESTKSQGVETENNSSRRGKRGKRQRSRPRKKSLPDNDEHTQTGRVISDPNLSLHQPDEGDKTLPFSSNTVDEFDFLDKLLEDTHLAEKLAENINKAIKGSHSSNGEENIVEENSQEQTGSSENQEKNTAKKMDISTIIEMTESDPAFQNFLKVFQHGFAIPISQLDVPELNFSAIAESSAANPPDASSSPTNIGNENCSSLTDEQNVQPNFAASVTKESSSIVSTQSIAPDNTNSIYHKDCGIELSLNADDPNKNSYSRHSEVEHNPNVPPDVENLQSSSHVAPSRDITDTSDSGNHMSENLELKNAEQPVCSELEKGKSNHSPDNCVQRSDPNQEHVHNISSPQNLPHQKANNQENESNVVESIENSQTGKASPSVTPLNVPTESEIPSSSNRITNSFIPPEENSMSVFSLIAKSVAEMTGEKYAQASEGNSFTTTFSGQISGSNENIDSKTEAATKTSLLPHAGDKVSSLNEDGKQIPSPNVEVQAEKEFVDLKKTCSTPVADEISEALEVNQKERSVNSDDQSGACPSNSVSDTESNREAQKENVLCDMNSEIGKTNSLSASKTECTPKEMQNSIVNVSSSPASNNTTLNSHTEVGSDFQCQTDSVGDIPMDLDTPTSVPADFNQEGEPSSSLPCMSTADAVLVTPVGLINSVMKQNLDTIDKCLSNCLAPLTSDSQLERLETVGERIVSEGSTSTRKNISSKGRKNRRVNIVTLQYASKKSENLNKVSDNTNDLEHLIKVETPVNFTNQCNTLSSPPHGTMTLSSDYNSPRKLTKGLPSAPSSSSLPATFADSNLSSSSFKSPPHNHSAFRPVRSRQYSCTQLQENSSPSVSKSTTKTVIAVNSEQAPFIPAHCKKNPSRRINPVEVSYSTPSPLQDFPPSPMNFVIDLPPSEPNSPCVSGSENPSQQGMSKQLFSPELQRNRGGASLPSCSYEEQSKKTPTRSDPSERRPREKEGSSASLSPLEKLGIPMPPSPSKRKPRRVVPVQLSSTVNKSWSSLVRSISPIKPQGDDAKTVSSTSDIQTDSHSEIEAFRMLKSFLSVSYSRPQPKQEITSSNQVSGISSSKQTPMSKCGCISRDTCKHRKGRVKKHLTPRKLVSDNDDGSEIVKVCEKTKINVNSKAKKSLGSEFTKERKTGENGNEKDTAIEDIEVLKVLRANEKTEKRSNVNETKCMNPSEKLLDGKNGQRNNQESVIIGKNVDRELVEDENIHCVKNVILKGLIESENRSHSPASVNSEESGKSFKVVGLVQVDKGGNVEEVKPQERMETDVTVHTLPPASYHQSARKNSHPTCDIVFKKGCKISADRYTLAVSEMTSFTVLSLNRTEEYKTECSFEAMNEDLEGEQSECIKDSINRLRQVSAGSSDDPAQKLNTGMINMSCISNSSDSEKDRSKDSKGEKVKHFTTQEPSISATREKTEDFPTPNVSAQVRVPCSVSKSIMAENMPNSVAVIDRLSEAQDVTGLFTSTPVSSKAKQHSVMVYSSSRKSESVTTATHNLKSDSFKKCSKGSKSKSKMVKSLKTKFAQNEGDICETLAPTEKTVHRTKGKKIHGKNERADLMSSDIQNPHHTKADEEGDRHCEVRASYSEELTPQQASAIEVSGEESNVGNIIFTEAATALQPPPQNVNSSLVAIPVQSTKINSLPVTNVNSDLPIPASSAVSDPSHMEQNSAIPVCTSHTACISSTYMNARGSLYSPLPVTSSSASLNAGPFTSLLNKPMSSHDINNILSDETGLSDCISGALRVAHDIGMSPLKGCNPGNQVNNREVAHGNMDNVVRHETDNNSILRQAMVDCDIPCNRSQVTNPQAFSDIPNKFYPMPTPDVMGHVSSQTDTTALHNWTPILPELSTLKTVKEAEKEKIEHLTHAFKKIAPKPPAIATTEPVADTISKPLCQIQVIQSANGPVVTLPPEYQGIFSKLLSDIGAPSPGVPSSISTTSFSTATTSSPIPEEIAKAVAAEVTTPKISVIKKKPQSKKCLKISHDVSHISKSSKNAMTPRSKKIKTRTRKLQNEEKNSDSAKTANDRSSQKKNTVKATRKIADRKRTSLEKSPLATTRPVRKMARDSSGRFVSKKLVSPSNKNTGTDNQKSVSSEQQTKCSPKSVSSSKKLSKIMKDKSPCLVSKTKTDKKSLTPTGKTTEEKLPLSGSLEQSKSNEKSVNQERDNHSETAMSPVEKLKTVNKGLFPSSTMSKASESCEDNATENLPYYENHDKSATDERKRQSSKRDLNNATETDATEFVSCQSRDKEINMNAKNSETGIKSDSKVELDESTEISMDFDPKESKSKKGEVIVLGNTSSDSEDDIPLSNLIHHSGKSSSQFDPSTCVSSTTHDKISQQGKKQNKDKTLTSPCKKNNFMEDSKKHINSICLVEETINSVIGRMNYEEGEEGQILSQSHLKSPKSIEQQQKETKQGTASLQNIKSSTSPRSKKSEKVPPARRSKPMPRRKTLYEIIEGLSANLKDESSARRKRKISKCDGTPEKRRRRNSGGRLFSSWVNEKEAKVSDSSDADMEDEEKIRLNTSVTVEDMKPARRICNKTVRMFVDFSSGNEIRIAPSEESYSLNDVSQQLSEQNRKVDSNKEAGRFWSAKLDKKSGSTAKLNSPRKTGATNRAVKEKGAKSPLKYMGSMPLSDLRDFFVKENENSLISKASKQSPSGKSPRRTGSRKPGGVKEKHGSKRYTDKDDTSKLNKAAQQSKLSLKKDVQGSAKLSKKSEKSLERLTTTVTAAAECNSSTLSREIESETTKPSNHSQEEIETALAIANLRFCMGDESNTGNNVNELSEPGCLNGYESEKGIDRIFTLTENPAVSSAIQKVHHENKTPASPLKHLPLKKRLSVETISSDSNITPEDYEKVVNDSSKSLKQTNLTSPVSSKDLRPTPTATPELDMPLIETSASRNKNQFQIPPQSLNSTQQCAQSRAVLQGSSQSKEHSVSVVTHLGATLLSANAVCQEQNNCILLAENSSHSSGTGLSSEVRNCADLPKPMSSEQVSSHNESDSNSVPPQSLAPVSNSESKLSPQHLSLKSPSQLLSAGANVHIQEELQTSVASYSKIYEDSADLSSSLEVSSTMSSPHSDSMLQSLPSGRSGSSKSKIEKLLKRLHHKKKV